MALDSGSEVPARWSLRLLGGFELAVLPGGARVTSLGKRERVLLAYLSLSAKGRQPRRKLATLLWGDANGETLLDNLRACVWKLRRALGDAGHRIVGSEGEDIVLDATAFEVDALAFRRLAAQSGRSELEAAAALCSGEFLDGLDIDSEEFESWRRAEATRYRDQTVEALNRLMTQLAENGEPERAMEMGERILRLEPLHEVAARRLMRLYGESGRRGAAAQLYRTLADTLKTEFGGQPEPETRTVFAEITRGGEERTNSPPRMVTHPGDAPGGLLRPPTSLAVRLRAPMAVLAGVAIVATALFSYGPFALLATSEGVVAEREAAADAASAIAIAVLPFLNLSGDAGQEFFSDGMTEEITSALAMVPDLKVVARTSAFQFKGKNNDIRAVGQALNATHLVEGSVRKVGERVRISAQLIEAGSGTHLWSENYDRQLSDIFAIQEEIARTVVGSLMAPLGLAPGERLISNRSIDPESYEQYLRGVAQVRSSDPGAGPTLETVVARAPSFAPGWAMLGGAYRAAAAVAARSGDFKADSLFTDKEEAAARKAIELDPSSASGYSELAAAQTRRGKWAEAEDLYKQALALDPNDSVLLHVYGQTLAAGGRLKDALRVRERLRTLEPLVPAYNQATARLMVANGQIRAGIAILEPDLSTGARRNIFLAEAYAIEGRFADAADALLRITSEIDRRSVEDAARLLRSAPGKTDQPAKLPALVGELGFVYAYVGAPERVLEYPEKTAKQGILITVSTVWHPAAAPIRKAERFKALVRSVGLVEYWRARGWPDLCRPIGADDFACD